MVALRLTLDNVANLPDGGPTSLEVQGQRSVDIGRNTYLDWTLPDPARVVSGRHCEIHYRDGGYWLTDISTNGTYLNGSDTRLTEPTRLKSGDRISIGDYLINVAVEDGSGPARAVEAPPASTPGMESAALWEVPDATAAPAERREMRRSHEARPVQGDALDWLTDLPKVVPPESPRASEGPVLPVEDREPPSEIADPTADPWAVAPSAPTPPVEPMPGAVSVASPATSEPAPDAAPVEPAGEATEQSPEARDITEQVDEPAPWTATTGTGMEPPSVQADEAAEDSSDHRHAAADTLGEAPSDEPDPVPAAAAMDAASADDGEPLEDAWQPAAEPAPANDHRVENPGTHSAAPEARPASAGFSAAAAESTRPASAGGGAEFERFAAALAEALEVPRGRLETGTPEELAERLGTFVRLTISGMQRLLKARSASQGYMRRGPGTQVQAVGNNPLKFMPTPAAAADVLFGPPSRSYLTLEDTLDESFGDLGAHQMALYSAMQAAVERMLRDLEPAAIEAGEGEERGFSIPGVSSKKAKHWDTYKERYNARASQHDNGMVDVFMLCFSDAYARAVNPRD